MPLFELTQEEKDEDDVNNLTHFNFSYQFFITFYLDVIEEDDNKVSIRNQKCVVQ